jgi:hypothetical protein
MPTPLRPAAALPFLWLAACAELPQHPPGNPAAAYRDTRLQYAILTADKAALKNEFKVNPDRSGLERGLTALTLPFAAAAETLFWPAQAAMTAGIAERPQP